MSFVCYPLTAAVTTERRRGDSCQPLLAPRGDGARARQLVGRPFLLHDLEASVIERRAARRLHAHDAFAPALFEQLQRAVVAIRVVAAPTEQRVRRPTATAL